MIRDSNLMVTFQGGYYVWCDWWLLFVKCMYFSSKMHVYLIKYLLIATKTWWTPTTLLSALGQLWSPSRRRGIKSSSRIWWMSLSRISSSSTKTSFQSQFQVKLCRKYYYKALPVSYTNKCFVITGGFVS